MIEPKHMRRTSVVSGRMLLAACCAVSMVVVPGTVRIRAAARSVEPSGDSEVAESVFPFGGQELRTLTMSLVRQYLRDFQHPETGVLYGARLVTKDRWTSPADIKVGKPAPWGYGSHIEDTALHGGHLLVALLDAYEACSDPFLRANCKKLFQALKFIGSVCPVAGLVPRGPHPDDPTAYYDDSSMDQHTTFIIALARYAASDLATDPERAWIRQKLQRIGERLEQYGWSIRQADGVTRSHVGFAWTGFNSHHASILLPTVLALYRATGNRHWQEAYERFSREQEGRRWKELEPGPHVKISGHPIYANQTAFRLSALDRFETDARRKAIVGRLLSYTARLQWQRRFPGPLLRSFFPEDVWQQAYQKFGWPHDYLDGCGAALALFQPSFLEQPNPIGVLAHVRFPLGGLHMMLLSEDCELIQQHVPQVWQMLTTVDLGKVGSGETNYLFSAVALHLYAVYFRSERNGNPATSNAGSSNSDFSNAGGGTASSAPWQIPSELYGRTLPIVASLGVGPVMDVAVDGNRACFIGSGKLFVSDVSQPSHPRVVGTLSGLGNVRQIVFRDGIAYVTAREDGLFIVDVHQPAAPKLVCHFDTIEFATGVALSENLLFVACRNYGVEIIDVSKPADPVHLSIVRTGEAQSVVARNGYLYAGVWGTSQVVAVDVHNPRRPKITASMPLDGFGDGVDVAENHLYVATGHHSRQPHKQENDPGFGRGHGLEIFDLSDPARPLFVARIKTPKLYHLGMDMWSVTVAGHYAFLADTYNGVFVIDVAEPQHPAFVAHCQLPRDAARGLPSPVGGLAVLEDTVYAAGAWSDMHVLAAPGLASRPTQEPDVAPSIPARTPDEPPNGFGEFQVYRPSGQVHDVDFVDDLALVACGSAGVHLIRLRPSVRLVRQIKTQGFAIDVRVLGRLVYVAESSNGLSIWRVSEDGTIELVGRYRPDGRTVRQVIVSPSGGYVLLQVGSHWLHIVDVRDPSAPKLVLSDQRLGLLYRDQIMDGLVDDRFACVFWHVSGLYWYDLGADPIPAYTGQNYGQRIGSANGLAAFGSRALTICRNGYAMLDRHETRPLTELAIHRTGSHRLRGKPTIFGDRLYVAHRPSGEVSIVNISDPEQPKLLKSFTTPGNPGRIVEQNGSVLIPDGYNGLLFTARESR